MTAALGVQEMKEIMGLDFPQWIMSGRSEPAGWLNAALQKFWTTFLADFIETAIKVNVNPILNGFKPMFLSQFELSEANLGSIAPTIVSVGHAALENAIQLDLQIKWAGNFIIVIVIIVIIIFLYKLWR
jgi:Ca2+-dependent lipid-binding protein